MLFIKYKGLLCLIDTGANFCFISERLTKDLPKLKEKEEIVGWNSKTMKYSCYKHPILGKVVKFDLTFIREDIDAVIGNDYLEKNNATIDYKEKVVYLQSEKYQIVF